MRSRLSLTALSGRPTTLKSCMRAEPTSTSTSTRWASMPYTEALMVLKSMTPVLFRQDDAAENKSNRYDTPEVRRAGLAKMAGVAVGEQVRSSAPALHEGARHVYWRYRQADQCFLVRSCDDWLDYPWNPGGDRAVSGRDVQRTRPAKGAVR